MVNNFVRECSFRREREENLCAEGVSICFYLVVTTVISLRQKTCVYGGVKCYA